MNIDMSELNPVDAEIAVALEEEVRRILSRHMHARGSLNAMLVRNLDKRVKPDLSWFSPAIERSTENLLRKLIGRLGLDFEFAFIAPSFTVDFFQTMVLYSFDYACEHMRQAYGMIDLKIGGNSRRILRKAFAKYWYE